MNMKKRFNEDFDDMAEDFGDMEREFRAGGVVITRYDYEALPDPMCAVEFSDEEMQKIAQDTYEYLLSNGWSDKEISEYLGDNLDYLNDDNDTAEMIKDDFWRFMEKAAIDNGMKYYEDMGGDEEDNGVVSESLSDGCSNIRIVGGDEAPITLQNKCPFCGKPHTIEVDMDEDEFSDRLFAYRRGGEFIQNAFPMLDANQREFIKTGICPKCWDSVMGGGDDEEYEESCVCESDGNTPEFLNVERFRKEITEVLEEATSEWDETIGDHVQYMKDSAPDFIDEYVEDIVRDTVESFNKLVHRDDTSMVGNFKDIRYDWEGFHNELPHGCKLREVVEMIDAGEDNEITREFKDWAVDWFFEAFGTYNL